MLFILLTKAHKPLIGSVFLIIHVTFSGSPTSESSRSSSSMSPTEENEILKSSKIMLSNKNSKLVDSSGLNLLTNKTPSQISLLGSNSSIANKSPSQISLLGSNSSISSLARSNVSIPDTKNAYSSGTMFQQNIRNSPLLDRARSPYGSPNLSDRSKSPYLQSLERSKSPYGSPIFDKNKSSYMQSYESSKSPIPVDRSKSPYSSPNLNNRDTTRSPSMKNGDYSSQTLDRYGTKSQSAGNENRNNNYNLDRFSGLPISITSSQICDNNQTMDKPLFSTLPRQRSIPTIIGMPRRLMEQRKSLPQVPSSKMEDFTNGSKQEIKTESKNPFEKLEGFTVPANPTGKNPFLDENEDTSYSFEGVSSRIMSFESKMGSGNGSEKENGVKMNPYVGVHTAQNAMYQTSIGQYGTVVTTSIPHSQIHTGSSMSSLQYSVPVSSGLHQIPKTSAQNGSSESTVPTIQYSQNQYKVPTHGSQSSNMQSMQSMQSNIQSMQSMQSNMQSMQSLQSNMQSMHSNMQSTIQSMQSSMQSMQSNMQSMQSNTQNGRKDQKFSNHETRYESSKLGYDPSKPGTIHEEISETPTPSSSTGTDSSRKDIGQEGDVESDADEIEIAEQADVVPELGSKMF